MTFLNIPEIFKTFCELPHISTVFQPRSIILLSVHASVLLYPVTKTCGQTISTNSTSFTNPSYPSADTADNNNCVVSVDLIDNNICQLRLDFTTFVLEQPSVDGVCLTDFFSITGTKNDRLVPQLCGTNTAQHRE